MTVDIETIVGDFARAMTIVDARRPIALSHRSKEPYQPGIGPHTEAATVNLVMTELQSWPDGNYRCFETGVAYPDIKRQKCDLCIGQGPQWEWAIEVKLLRFLGDNGQPNDNMLMHILSPYPEHRSALTDCTKLLGSSLSGRKAILIYGFDSDEWPLDPAVEAFELLACARAKLGRRKEATFQDLVHPVHATGRVFGWELSL